MKSRFILSFFILLFISAYLPSEIYAQLVRYEWEQIFYAKFEENKEKELTFAKNMNYSKLALGDLDNDGDYDLFVGDANGLISYFENTGTSKKPEFVLKTQSVKARFKHSKEKEEQEEENEEDLNGNFLKRDSKIFEKIDVESYSAPLLIDLDQDLDLDLLIGNGEGRIYYFKNTGNNSDFRFDFITDNFYEINVGKRVVPAKMNLKFDKFPDLILGNAAGEIYRVKNTGYGDESTFMEAPIKINQIFEGYNSSPSAIDWDRDGDIDIISGQRAGYLVYFENNGDRLNPQWDLTNDYFQGIDAGGESSPFFADLNGDELPDVIIGNINNYIPYFENRTYLDEKVFWSIDNNITRFKQLLVSGSRAIMSAGDINNDGLEDLIIGQASGKLVVYLNRGLKDGIANLELYSDDLFSEVTFKNSAPEFVDMNNDGLFDIVVGSASGNLTYFRNQGTKEEPKWILEDSNFGEIFLEEDIFPRLFDIDQDRDPDLFLGVQKGKPVFYRNLGTPIEPAFIKDEFVYDLRDLDLENTESTLAFINWNQSDRFDLKLGTGRGEIFTIAKREGEKFVPVTLSDGRQVPLQIPPLKDVDWYFDKKLKLVSPYYFDFDKDKQIDLFVASQSGSVFFFRQKESERLGDSEILRLGEKLLKKEEEKRQNALNPADIIADPIFVATDKNILPESERFNRPVPSFGDVDNDGDQDLILGNHFGKILFYENQGDKYEWDFTKKPTNIALPGKNYNTAPLLFDFDKDGDFDLVVGNESGRVFYLENKGTLEKPEFRLNAEEFRRFRAGTNSIPTVFYQEGMKDAGLLIGNIHGRLNLIDTDQVARSTGSPKDHRIVDQNFLNIDIGLAASPRFFDLNNDKISEIILGADSGKMLILQKNTDPKGIPPWKERKDYLPKGAEFPPGIFPTVADLDGDGDKDLIVGIDNGELQYFRNDALKPRRRNSMKTVKVVKPENEENS